METLPMSPDVVPGQDVTSASPQVAETISQEVSQSQEQTTPQVEGVDLNASSQEDTRRASDFETARQLKRMMKEMQSLKQTFERVQTQQAPQSIPQTQPQLTQEELQRDPMGVLRKIVQSEMNSLRTEIPQHIQKANEFQRKEQAEQEALKLIKTNSSVKSDPQWQNRIEDILSEEDDYGNSLDKYSLQNPRHAAQLALKEYQSRYMGGKTSQAAPTKAQMQTTATAVTPGMAKASSTQEAEQLYRQMLKNPELMQNTEFLKKLASFDQKARLEASLRG